MNMYANIKWYSEESKLMNQQDFTAQNKDNQMDQDARFIRALKSSLLMGSPFGLLSGLVIYCTSPVFSLAFSFMIGIASIVIISTILFIFVYGKDLPKQIIDSNRNEPIPLYKFSIDNSAIQAYNRANGNPSASFIMPPK